MTWSAVGSPVTGYNRFSTPISLTVSPTVGDVLVLALANDYGVGSSALSVSGGGVTTWHGFNDGTSGVYGPESNLNFLGGYLLWGIVDTTVTALLVSTSNNGVGAIVQEFANSGTISEDSVYGPDSGHASSGNYYSVTPSQPSELYVAVMGSRDPASPGGSTGGFTYVDLYNIYVGGMQLVYNTNAVGAQSPAFTLSSTRDYVTFGAFLLPGTQTMQIIGII